MSNLTFEVEPRFLSWRWVLRHNNGSLVAMSRDYSRKSDVRRAINRLKSSVVDADVKDTARVSSH